MLSSEMHLLRPLFVTPSPSFLIVNGSSDTEL
jgi:hypothetical protein